MNFSQALTLIKEGRLLTRLGWNGKGMFIYLVNESEFKVNRPPLNSIYPDGCDVTYRGHIDMKYADGTIGVWLASMGDLLADDWEISFLNKDR